MTSGWTFGQRLAVGFALTLVLTLLLGVVAVSTLRGVGATYDRLAATYVANQFDVERVQTLLARRMAANRGFLLTGAQEHLDRATADGRTFGQAIARIRSNVRTEPERAALDRVEAAERTWTAAWQDTIRARRAGQDGNALAARFDAMIVPRTDVLERELASFGTIEAARLASERDEVERNAANAVTMLIGIVIAAAVAAVLIGIALTRSLTRLIGGATQDLSASSAELQAAANQQATGSGEQASSLIEVSSTMKELLATSRQITESARRVAQIADETAGAAHAGDERVARASEAVADIKRQVDVIVQHMLELGRKSQQVGGILEIIKELAEQTNILSINAAIEAAGAGEAGRRFGVVAEEVRKLADRVAGSAGEIRTLIDDIRSASNTTVMATEQGAKAVEAGQREFGELAASFRGIVGQVGTTAEAAREIELSIKQQTTAVEQVNVAVNDVAQAAKEMETSSRQTLETSSQLARVSRELAALVRRGGA